MLDLTIPENAYMFGYFLADAHLEESKENAKGRLRIEINEVDRAILESFQSIIPCYSNISSRSRITNFGCSQSAILTIYNQDFRRSLKEAGFPAGKKSHVVSLPSCPFSERDFFRGMVDGDGSLGLTGKGLPFLSLVTVSHPFADAYMALIERECKILKTSKQNIRDNAFNIMLNNEDAQTLVRFLYYPECLAISRKMEKATKVLSWVRPETLKKRSIQYPWTETEDMFIKNHSFEESSSCLNRSPKSIKIRLWRLRGGTTPPRLA